MHKLFRVLYYLLGMVLLAIGITLNTKTALGVSPLISIGYAVSQVAGLNFGNMTFVVYAAFVVIQFLLRRRNARWKDALQLLVALLFSQLLNVFDLVLAYEPATLPGKLVMLVGAVALTGIGAAITLTMDIIPNPGDGLVSAVADTFHMATGLAKNLCDAASVALTLAVGLVFEGRVIGIGLGTLITVLLCGRVMALYNHTLMNPARALAGMAPSPIRGGGTKEKAA